MQPCSRDLQPLNSMMPFDTTSLSSQEDFFEQIISSLNNPSSSSSCSSWPDLSNPNPNPNLPLKTAFIGGGENDEAVAAAAENGVVRQYRFEEDDDQSSEFLSSKLRHHQINPGGGSSSSVAAAAAKAMMLHHHLMLSGGLVASDGLNLLPMPVGLGDDDQNDVADGSSFKSGNPANDSAVQALFSGFSAHIGQTTTTPPPQFHHLQGGVLQGQNFGGAAAAEASGGTPVNQAAPPGGTTVAAAPKQQRVRARRGQATDPHSIAERLRRERIAERMKSLQELVPNANKTDKASMLDEIIEYVKFLQLQVKVLSMSRLGGAAAVAPLVSDMASPAGRDRGRSNGTQTGPPSSNEGGSGGATTTMTEQQVAKLMEEDMGSAMQYLQGKGLCLMPISLATAISTATCHPRNAITPGGPTSPSGSVLTVANAVGEAPSAASKS